MPFLYPKSFPFCVVDGKPPEVPIFNIYPAGFSLTDAMALIWRATSFNVAFPSVTLENQEWVPTTVSQTTNTAVVSFEGLDPREIPKKMSEMICPPYTTLGYNANFSYLPVSIYGTNSTQVQIQISNQNPVYFYQEKYWPYLIIALATGSWYGTFVKPGALGVYSSAGIVNLTLPENTYSILATSRDDTYTSQIPKIVGNSFISIASERGAD